MKALWVTAIPPDHEGGGGAIRQAHLIDALATKVETRLLVAGRLTDLLTRKALAAVYEVTSARLPGDPTWRPARRVRDLRYALVERAPFEVAQHRKVRITLAGPLAELAPEADLVCVEFAGLAPLLPKRRTGHWSLTLHNLSSGMAAQRMAVTEGRRRWLHGVERANAKRFERWAVDAFDTTIVVSEADAAALPGDALVVPNGVDVDRLAPTPVPSGAAVVFTGALHTLPNVDGITWFCAEVWPLVRERVPEATLAIAGARPDPAVARLASLAGVAVSADVASVRPFLESARVSLVPLRIGTGTRLKALEAMSAGRPVVGTSIGLEGLDVVPGVHASVADEPGSFAGAVVDLLTNDDRAAAMAAEGRALVEARYSWARIGRNYVDALLSRVLDGRRPASPGPSPPT